MHAETVWGRGGGRPGDEAIATLAFRVLLTEIVLLCYLNEMMTHINSLYGKFLISHKIYTTLLT